MQKIKTFKLNKASKVGFFCKFDLIVHNWSELVTWFVCRMLAALMILQIPSVFMLDLTDNSSFSYLTMVLFKL